MNAVPLSCEFAATEKTGRCQPARIAKARREQRLLPIVTFVLWSGCASVAALGLALAYPLPHAKSPEPAPVMAEFLNIELSNDPRLFSEPPRQLSTPAEVSLPSAPAQLPQAAPAIALLEPAFPIGASVNVSPTDFNSDARPVAGSPANANAGSPSGADAENIVFGRGEGKQPAPEYPFLARRQGQQGTVQVRFTVGENGRIVAAELAEPSAWPLLNASALKTIRNSWRFASGKTRLCQVSIHFTL